MDSDVTALEMLPGDEPEGSAARCMFSCIRTCLTTCSATDVA